MRKSIENNLSSVKARLHAAADVAGRSSTKITLLAVSKTRSASCLRQAYACGLRSFGENYLQEALKKQAELNDLSIEWHFIGPIQSNKTRAIAENFDWVHSVDRVKIARRLSDQRLKSQPPLNICLQVNLDQEASKSGFSLEEVADAAAEIACLPHISLRGLMAIPAKRDRSEEQEHAFRKLFNALEDLKQSLPGQALDTLSMGMSADLEPAIKAGSTMVRIGTDLFGPRD